MNFMQYILINESNLEDLFVSDDATDNIELLHEMEWKLRLIIDNQYRLNPKMYTNIIKRFSGFAIESYEDLSDKFYNVSNYWIEVHAIEDPITWATAIVDNDDYSDSMEHEGAVHIGGVSTNISEIVENMSIESLRDIVEREVGDLVTAFEHDIPSFLFGKGIKPPKDFEDDDDYWEDNTDEAVEYINEHDLEDELIEYALTSMQENGVDAYSFYLGRQGWIDGLAQILYPKYYGEHGSNIEEVTPDVEENMERLIKGDELAKEGDNIRIIIHSDDVDLDKNVERLMDIVGKLASAISLAMNVYHTSGNIMIDYGSQFGLEDVDADFLDDFHERSIDDWREEMKKIVR